MTLKVVSENMTLKVVSQELCHLAVKHLIHMHIEGNNIFTFNLNWKLLHTKNTIRAVFCEILIQIQLFFDNPVYLI